MNRGSQVSSGDASQTAPLQGTCSGCGLTRRLHSDGRLVYRHGLHNKPCPGSGKPPTSIIDHSQSSDISKAAGIQVPGVSSQVCAAIDVASVQRSDPLPHVTCGGPTIKHIPKSTRVACVGMLTQLLDEVLGSLVDEGHWLNLLSFGDDILSKPSRGGRWHSLSPQIKKRCSNTTVEMEGRTGQPREGQRKSCPDANLAEAVTSKIESGNLKAAIRLLCSDETVAPFNLETTAHLRAKHPASTLGMEPLPWSRWLPVSHSYTQGSYGNDQIIPVGLCWGGNDGLLPQHLVDLLNCKESGLDLVSRLTDSVNLMLEGKCPDRIRRILFGGKLIALRKKDRGIRSIAIGCYWRRLTSKVANNRSMIALAEYFVPLQVGVGVSGGCEAAVHAARRFLSGMPEGWVMVKLDFSNAFNSLHRRAILEAIVLRAPDLYRYCHASYAAPSSLIFEEFEISSEEGI